MRSIIKRYAIIAITANTMQMIVSSFVINGQVSGFLLATFILFIIFTLIKPVVHLVLLPIHILTMNLSAWILSIVTIALWILILPNVTLNSWNFPGVSLGSANISSAVLPLWQTVIIFSIIMVCVMELYRYIFN